MNQRQTNEQENLLAEEVNVSTITKTKRTLHAAELKIRELILC